MLTRLSSSDSTSLWHSLTFTLAHTLSLPSFENSSTQFSQSLDFPKLFILGASVYLQNADRCCSWRVPALLCTASLVAIRRLFHVAFPCAHLPKRSHILRPYCVMPNNAHSLPLNSFFSNISCVFADSTRIAPTLFCGALACHSLCSSLLATIP